MPLNMGLRPLTAALLLCTLLVVQVNGHGYMSVPPTRNWYGKFGTGSIETYTPAGGNGQGSPGPCGDPFEGGTQSGIFFANMAFERLGKATAYTVGQTINVKLSLSAVHGGRFAFQICDRTANLDHACFNRFLTRRDIPGERYTWIFDSTSEYSLDYVLPADFSCPNGCVLRWEYFTGTACIPDCDPKICRGYSTGRNYGADPGPGLCSALPLAKPEKFYNCADVRIGGTAGPNPPPPIAPPPPVGPPPPQPPPPIAPPPIAPPPLAPPPIAPPPFTPPPSTTCQQVASPGGACGSGTCCPSGQCCSQYGSCGTTTAHCGTGCQSSFGACSGTAPPPLAPPPLAPPPLAPPPVPPTPPMPPVTQCVDTFPACPGWVGQCAAAGVAYYCPCMCGKTVTAKSVTSTSAGGDKVLPRPLLRRTRRGAAVATPEALATATVPSATVVEAGPKGGEVNAAAVPVAPVAATPMAPVATDNTAPIVPSTVAAPADTAAVGTAAVATANPAAAGTVAAAAVGPEVVTPVAAAGVVQVAQP